MIINNEPFYDDRYDTCDETYVTLRVYSGDLPPKEVTDILGVKPTDLCLKGKGCYKYQENQLILEKTRNKEKIKNGWFLSSEDEVNSKDLRRHLDWILDKIISKKDELFELKKVIEFIDISCYWRSKHGMGGPTLSTFQLKRLAELEIEIWFEFFK